MADSVGKGCELPDVRLKLVNNALFYKGCRFILHADLLPSVVPPDDNHLVPGSDFQQFAWPAGLKRIITEGSYPAITYCPVNRRLVIHEGIPFCFCQPGEDTCNEHAFVAPLLGVEAFLEIVLQRCRAREFAAP